MTELDARLVERTIGGDDSAFDELVSRHRRRVCHTAARRLGNWDSADDMAQEAFVRAYMTLTTLRKPESFGAWVVGIVENLCRMDLRKRHTEIATDQEAETVPAKPQPEAHDLLERIDSLAVGTRQAAELYFQQGKSMAEVGLILGISLSAVKSRIRDARRGLQKEDVPMKSKTRPEHDAFDQELQRRLELARWFREFGKMASSGIPLHALLDNLSKGPFSEPVIDATVKLRKAVLDGTTMSEALRILPALRTPETVSLVRAGEVGGIIDRTARVLADWIDVGSAQREIELSFWLRTLGEMIHAGVPLDAALSWGIEYPANVRLGATLKKIATASAEGKPIAPIIREADDDFPPCVRLAIIAGENAGCLGFSLRWAGDELAAEVCARLTGSVPRVSSDRCREDFANEIARLLPGENPATRRIAITALGSLGCAGAAESIVESLSDPEASVRLAAIRALANLKAERWALDIAARLDDSEAEIRLAAVLALRDLAAKEYAPRLCSVIRDPNRPTAKAAMDTVEEMGEINLLTSFAIEVLTGEPSPEMDFGLDILLAHPVPEAIPVLIASLERAPNIAITSALILAGLGKTEGIPILREALGMRIGITVSYAAEALESLKDRESAPIIREAVHAGRLSEGWLKRADELSAV